MMRASIWYVCAVVALAVTATGWSEVVYTDDYDDDSEGATVVVCSPVHTLVYVEGADDGGLNWAGGEGWERATSTEIDILDVSFYCAAYVWASVKWEDYEYCYAEAWSQAEVYHPSWGVLDIADLNAEVSDYEFPPDDYKELYYGGGEGFNGGTEWEDLVFMENEYIHASQISVVGASIPSGSESSAEAEAESRAWVELDE